MKTENEKRLSGTARKDRVVDINDKDYLTYLPPAPINLTKNQKKYYKKLGDDLIKSNRLKDVDLLNLALFAFWIDAFVMNAEILNEKGPAGMVQKFASGASQVSVEFTLVSQATEKVRQFSKMFGMSFKDRFQMLAFFSDNGQQLDMFSQLEQELSKHRAG